MLKRALEQISCFAILLWAVYEMTLYVTLRIVQDIFLEGMRQKLFSLAILPCLILRWFKFLFRTNFTSHFFSLCSIFFKVLIKKKISPFMDLDKFHQPTPAIKTPL